MSAVGNPLAILPCDICGCTPCASQTFCKTCRIVDARNARAAAKPAAKPARRPTPQVTIEAVMYCVRTRGLPALQEPANLERLSRCDPAALAEINRRIDALFQKGILK
jgi:hypothetical protein